MMQGVVGYNRHVWTLMYTTCDYFYPFLFHNQAFQPDVNQMKLVLLVTHHCHPYTCCSHHKMVNN